MRAIIISSGNLNLDILRELKSDKDMIICADGGAKHLYESEIVPDMIVGDLDSLDEKFIKYYENLNVKFYRYSSEKDYTDTELAVEYAIEEGNTELILLGSTGTRLDHTLANIMLLYKLLNRNIKAKIVDENNEISIVKDSINIEREANTYVSLLPIFGDCMGVSMSGFKYPTDNLNFELGSTMGISNEVSCKVGTIDIASGVSVVIKSRD